MKKKDGDYMWCDVATKIIQTSKGKNRIVVVLREISERKEKQEKLEEFGALCDIELHNTQKYLEQLISRLPLALVAWDKDCKIKTWNPKATQMFGFS